VTDKTIVGLVQINNSFSGQNYLPYSVGLLQAYALENAENAGALQFLSPIYSRMAVHEAVEHLHSADVVGFSAYVWNIRLSLAIAEVLKERNPQTVIVFGGPQVPDQAEQFLRHNPFIDLVCHGEGEQVFSRIIERYMEKAWHDIPAVSYLEEDGKFITHPRGGRAKDLELYPSPYLSHVFLPLMAENPDSKWLALWETNRGCPFACTFCDWGSAIASKVFKFGMDRLIKEVEWFATHHIEFIFCCDANFGMLPRDYDIVRCVGDAKRTYGYPQALSVQNTKNATDRAYKVQKLLHDEGLNKGVTISFQSMDPDALKASKRHNISTKSFQELQARFSKDGIPTYSDMILGLPEETYDSFANGIDEIIANGQHNRIQFNNLSILPNAEMGNAAYQQRFGMKTVLSPIINIHGSLEGGDHGEIPEYQELVIATAAMPEHDWVRTRALCWMTGLTHFDKLLQIPLVILHEIANLRYREMFEAFMRPQPPHRGIFSNIREFFLKKAKDIQSGGTEYCYSHDWLGIWWPADEFIMIRLCTEDQLAGFYQEAEEIFGELVIAHHVNLPSGLLHDCLVLNRHLLKTPFHKDDVEINLNYKLYELYQSLINGKPLPLLEERRKYIIDRSSQSWATISEWCREVVWYGNKKGAYLYGTQASSLELAGHY
jgi:radical SAM superfamily enzyme YgiQ (UPF0313 family)